MNDRVPSFDEFFGRDYSSDLALAKIARLSYESRATIDNVLKLGGSASPGEDWRVLGQEADNFRDFSSTSGLVAAALVDAREKRIVIAFRGTDQMKDLTGPMAKLTTDGDLLKELGAPSISERGDNQLREIQKFANKMLGGDDWHPQFAQALDYAGEISEKYLRQGYTIEVVGFGLGGSMAQLTSHAYGLPGRAFDPVGAKNVAESQGYQEWLAGSRAQVIRGELARAGLTPGTPDFTNYLVNNSEMSQATGPHLGWKTQISGFTGREGFAEHAKYVAGAAAGVTEGLIESLPPFVGGAVKGIPKAAAEVIDKAELAAKAARGADLGDKADIDRIIRLFEKAVERGKLSRFGQDQEQDTGLDPRGGTLAATPRDPGHRDHVLYRQIRSGVEFLDASLGRATDTRSECLTASLLAQVKRMQEQGQPMTRVDSVVLNAQTERRAAGELTFAIQGGSSDPSHRRTHVETAEAIRTAENVSFDAVQRSNESIDQQQRLARQQEMGVQQPEQRKPHGPALA